MLDIVSAIATFNAGRDPERLALKYRAMRRHAFVFLRGTCHLFHARLPDAKPLRKAPAVWACGDLHLENFGSYKGDNRLSYFDINDFDESALAPLSWDLLRFLTSVHVGADILQITPTDACGLCDSYLQAYYTALALGKARWVERDTAHGLIGDLLHQLKDRQRPAYLDSRTERRGKRRRLRVDGHKALPASETQREAVCALIRDVAATQDQGRFFEVLDVARRVAGTGSLGQERYVVLVHGKGSPDGNYLLDLKRAQTSSLLPYLEVPQPAWPSQAHRIVALQQRVQAVPMAFLHPIRQGRTAWVLRALQPSEDRITLEGSGKNLALLRGAIEQMGQCTAWAHLRGSGRQGSAIADELIDIGLARRWRKTLLSTAQDCAAQVQQDWAVYAQAYDDGALACQHALQ